MNLLKIMSWYEWLLIILLLLLVIMSVQMRRVAIESSKIYPFTSTNNANLYFNVNPEQIKAVRKDLEMLLSADDELVVLENNGNSDRFNLKKIVLTDYSKTLDEVDIESSIEIKATLDDGKNSYMWITYDYAIVDKNTGEQLIKKEGIERLYLNGESSGDEKLKIESSVSIPSYEQAFYGI